MTRVVLGATLADRPSNGGGAWVRASWVRGLQRLGLDVVFVDQLVGSPEPSALRWFDDVVAKLGLDDSATLLDADGRTLRGLPRDALLDTAADADLFVNLAGHVRWEPLLRAARRKVYVDLDPGFTQLWHAAGDGARLEGHDVHFTLGENVGRPGCPVPTNGIAWRTTRPPVVLEDWPLVEAKRGDERFTTVASWRGPFGRIEHDGHTYGVKLDEFRKVVELPRRTTQRFELALDIHDEETRDLELLREHGWNLAQPQRVAGDLDAFRRYVQGSLAEFSVAKGIYVETESGWFSDRSTRYLASGKPVLCQDTGFSRHLPVGQGLLAFRTLDEAVAGVESIAADHERHAGAARALADEHFDSDKVLGRFLEEALA